ncbi:MAG: bifunctional oligoribonuclease/PAP phosphatase NrnA [Candidatus Omnitrophica bacterium]|nr:bifunctional oligoribonuclease/PAP phosphatase NrnA [Candidatus Omnitrophota bacterium]
MSLKKVTEAIRRNKRFMVSAHINPESDALGSALALKELLRKLGKEVKVVNDGGTPGALEFLPGSETVLRTLPKGWKPEIALTVDVPVFARVGGIGHLLRQAKCLISIDHHVSHERFGHINWVDPAAAATGEMIYRLHRAMHVPISKAAAVCMYAALVTDTGSFKYRNTNSAVHRIAADLLKIGKINPMIISQHLYEAHRLKDLRLLGEILTSLKSTPDGRVAWVEVPRALMRKVGSEVIDELVNYPRAVKGVEVAIAMREPPQKGEVRCSLRSKGAVDVDKIARVFGGGGHMAASGCTVSGTLPQARQKMLAEIQKHLPKRNGRTAHRR